MARKDSDNQGNSMSMMFRGRDMKKRFTAILLTFITLSPITACGNTDSVGSVSTEPVQSESETDALEETEKSYLDTFEQINYNGAEFAMVGIDDDSTVNFSDGTITGEAINDAIYNRDRFIEEHYGVKITTKSYPYGKDDSLSSDIKKLVRAGDGYYSMILASLGAVQVPLMSSGVLYDISSMPAIDMTQPWWSTYANTNLKIANKLFFTTGDICPMYYNTPYIMCFNMRIADNYNIDMFNLVLDGKWTLDRLDEFADTFTVDLDGDGVITPTDQVAYTHVRTPVVSNSHYIACGQTLNTIDAEGNIQINLGTEASVNVVEKLQGIFTKLSNNYFDMETSDSMFVTGNAFLFGNSMATAVSKFRNMEDDFGFLPLPKYDEKQENYYTSVNLWTRGYVGVPLTVPDPDMAGHIMEIMAYLSYDSIRPAAYDAMLYNKMSRTEESNAMLDLIYGGIYLDINYVMDFGGSMTAVNRAVMEGAPFASIYAKCEQKIAADIKKMEEKILG